MRLEGLCFGIGFFIKMMLKILIKKSMHIDLDEMAFFLPEIDWYKFWL
jgi:hypothetical protein